jgi:protein-arginine kinase activator protein McsA
MTSSSKEIVPWVCHVCKGESNTPGGGICARCKQPTCRSHINDLGEAKKLEFQWVCDHCLTTDENIGKQKQKKPTLKLPNISLKRDAGKKRRAP